MARKPKYDYQGEEFLEKVKALARTGLTDKEIALSLDLRPDEFSKKKSSIPQLSQALLRARTQVNSAVRQKYLAMGLGGVKTKTIVRKKTELPDGTLMDGGIISETETELPPNVNVLATWLFNHDEEWRQSTIEGKKLDITSNGKDMNPSIQVEIIDNRSQIEDTDNKDI